ncbi:hypothetical protein E2562_014312 [Oryza meyeriana var. granulata]|uniref:Uncharacterized protein n=1 Tax=Oryza meyeriana var. granulata TaxID=110450 RepID=A0A6G1C7X7_9ORYZ|nr:hypothetical protein E2562_014312 [Oryza meyeriana var. granulata]
MTSPRLDPPARRRQSLGRGHGQPRLTWIHPPPAVVVTIAEPTLPLPLSPSTPLRAAAEAEVVAVLAWIYPLAPWTTLHRLDSPAATVNELTSPGPARCRCRHHHR